MPTIKSIINKSVIFQAVEVPGVLQPHLWDIFDERDSQFNVGEAVEIIQPADLRPDGQEKTHQGKEPANQQQEPGRPRHPLTPSLKSTQTNQRQRTVTPRRYFPCRRVYCHQSEEGGHNPCRAPPTGPPPSSPHKLQPGRNISSTAGRRGG